MQPTIHSIVLLLMALYQAAGYRRRPDFVSLASLHLRGSPDETNKAVREASSHGWLATGGEPVHSVKITARGIEELERRRLA